MKWHPFDVSKTSKRQSKPEPTKRMLDENSSSSTTTRSAQKEDWLTKATDALIFQNQQDKERFLSRLASTSSTLSNNGEEETTITIGPHYLIDDSNSGGESSSSNSTKSVMPFIPESFIVDMHHAPRFGHSNRLGKLVSSTPGDPLDYASGLKQFTLFILIPFFCWGLILFMFKYIYGTEKVGCAAGGEVLDMVALSRAGIKRKERKRRILRSWRLQTIFLLVAVLIPTISMIMMECGWKSLDEAWEEVRHVVDDVEALAFRGWNVLDSLQETQHGFYNNTLVQEILQSKNKLIFQDWCPNTATSGESSSFSLKFLQDGINSIQSNAHYLVDVLDPSSGGTSWNKNAFIVTTQVTKYLDESITWFFDHDWLLKLFLMIINVLNILMLLSCYFLSKNNIIHAPSRMYLSVVVLPLFIIFTIMLLFITSTSGVATLMNADFCAGGPGPSGSPQGTIEDAILSYQYGRMERQQVTGNLGLIYDSFLYFSEGCLTKNPLAFLDVLSLQVEEAVETVSKLSSGMPIGDNQTIALLNEACGADVSFLPATLDDLATKLTSVQGNLNAFVNLASCHQVSPLVRRVTHGALCNESAYGLVWIWACSFTICVLNFVLLTTRAALFNSIKAKKPRPHKPKRVVEKEFQEYKDFMSPYYEDAHEWKMQSKMKKAVEIDFGSQILQNPTFETHATTKPSFDNCSEGADMNRSEDDGDDESSYGSSYESFDEDDSQASEESDDDSQSAMLSFMTETKSIAMHALDTVKKLKPLLGNFGKRDNDNDNDGDEDSVLEESLFLEEDSVPEESLFLEDSSVRRARSPSLDSDGGDGVWNMMITPPNRNMPLFSGFRVLSVLTPTAPQKAFSRLSRTKAADVDPSELDPLTTPPKTQPSITNNSGDDDDVRPRHLKLSPFFLPGESQPRTPQQSSLRIHSDEDSEDGMPIYYEDGVPKRPKKAYRRYGRTRASHGEDYKR